MRNSWPDIVKKWENITRKLETVYSQIPDLTFSCLSMETII